MSIPVAILYHSPIGDIHKHQDAGTNTGNLSICNFRLLVCYFLFLTFVPSPLPLSLVSLLHSFPLLFFRPFFLLPVFPFFFLRSLLPHIMQSFFFLCLNTFYLVCVGACIHMMNFIEQFEMFLHMY